MLQEPINTSNQGGYSQFNQEIYQQGLAPQGYFSQAQQQPYSYQNWQQPQNYGQGSYGQQYPKNPYQ